MKTSGHYVGGGGWGQGEAITSSPSKNTSHVSAGNAGIHFLRFLVNQDVSSPTSSPLFSSHCLDVVSKTDLGSHDLAIFRRTARFVFINSLIKELLW